MKENKEIALQTAIYSLLVNIVLAIAKALAGFFGYSYALIADAIESAADVFSSILVLLGLRYANKPPDKNHPYGHGRIEPLVTFAIVGFLLVSAVFIAYESILNIQTPHQIPKTWTLYVLGAIIIWKEVSYQVVLRRGKQINSSTLKAEAWHHRSDAITSVAAFVGISIALFLGKGYEAADDWAALFAAGIILYNSYKIFRPALGEIMDENTYEDMIQEIRKIALTVDGVVDTEKCLIRKVGLQYLVDLHAEVDGDLSVFKGHEIAHQLKDTLQQKLPHIGNVLVHIEPANHKNNSEKPNS